MSGREKTKDAQRFPLAWQGTGVHSACGWKLRSRLPGLLSRRNTASHRCVFGPDTGRSPSVRSRFPGTPLSSPATRPFPSKSSFWHQKNRRTQGPRRSSDVTSCIGIARIRFGGSKRDASSQPCGSPVVFGLILHPPPGTCQGPFCEKICKPSCNGGAGGVK